MMNHTDCHPFYRCTPMSADPETPKAPLPKPSDAQSPAAESEKVLCPHCLRTAKNGIKCQGICVADSDY
jgi:hypothetical protein